TEVLVFQTSEAGVAIEVYANKKMKELVKIEQITADAGMDIGITLIGMNLKHVAVPRRFNKKKIGKAQVTVAKTLLKRIGGERASYVPKKSFNKIFMVITLVFVMIEVS